MSVRKSTTPSPFTFTFRNQLVESYSEFIEELKSWNWDGYYLNFMFDHISGGERQRKERMFSDVKRAHDLLGRHIVHKRKSAAWQHLLPVFIVCPDYPVPKCDLFRKLEQRRSLLNAIVPTRHSVLP